MAESIHQLESDWVFKETSGERVTSWLPVHKVPTNVHLDLMHNDVIPDPFIDYNELKCEWVAETSWTYKTTLPKVEELLPHHCAILSFDGLDTFATVYLNSKPILVSDNMFLSHRVDISNELSKSAQNNELEIRFESAFKKAREIKDRHPEHKWVGHNGDMSRLAVRKAQYHWGWDWGPILCPCGPWRPIRLEIFRSRISNLTIDYTLSSKLTSANGSIKAEVDGSIAGHVEFIIRKNKNVIFQQSARILPDHTSQVEFSIDAPELWFPHGYGRQELYEFEATPLQGKSELVGMTKRVGFRRVELVQNPDEIGKSFYFRINGYDIFCGGSNWIPADSFTPRVTSDKYRTWLQMMVDGYQTMIRVWGGGIYEEDVFYDICDEMGILCWQDFAFGCGNYPAFPNLLESIREEAKQNVQRLRHHACLVIFAGNNEDYQIQEEFGLTYNYEDKDPENWLKTDFPARYVYEKILPEVMKSEAPHIAYHPGSPWGDGIKTSDPKIGDMHQWNVWHGTQEKYQIFDTLGGRFNSEFGMEAFPHIDTIRAFCTDTSQLFPQSRTLDFHNKADGHERRIATYLVENFRTVTSLEGYIHLTQLSQAEALMFGYRGWRKQWGQKRHCGGALVWQLNDCWPVTSWSIVDYFQRKKAAYYTMRRVLAPIAVAVKRDHWDWSVVHARLPKVLGWECWVASREATEVRGLVELRFISIASGKEIKPMLREKAVIRPNRTTVVFKGEINAEVEEPHVLAARLWIGQEVAARDCDWPQPLKYLDFADRAVTVDSTSTDAIVVTAKRPTKGLIFEERPGVLITDSAIDVVPGDAQTITVNGMDTNDAPLQWRYLGME